ncbi:MAG: pyrroloquinoline quinone-dependent dehydrogenase, partial [Verrucomicrobia bacterium]|nr:pyrroloquinoline quinone-dependent dehydrogenase [Verrucomicrobiota bacterium]
MIRTSLRSARSGLAAFSCLIGLFAFSGSFAQTTYDTSNGQWPSYGGDLANSKYSPLDQINRDTIKDLEIAWVWNSPDDALKPLLKAGLDRFKATPLMIDGVLYVRTSLNIAAAIDAESGATLWGFNPESYKFGRPASYGFTTRGLAYWKDAEDQRLFLATGDSKLIALDPKT